MIEFLTGIPIWIWVIGILILYGYLFGDKKIWEYEAKFPQVPKGARGEIELERYQKQGTKIKVELHLHPSCINKEIEVFLGQRLIYKIPAERSQKSRLYLNESLELKKPEEGEIMTVKIGNNTLLEGVLIRD